VRAAFISVLVRALHLPAKCLWHSVYFATEASNTSLLHLCPLSVLSDRAVTDHMAHELVTQALLEKVRANGTCVCRMIYCLHFLSKYALYDDIAVVCLPIALRMF
jgi:hypothetical protein